MFCTSAMDVVMLVPVHFPLEQGARNSRYSVLGTMADADIHVDAVTVLGECFLQAEIVGDDVKGGCRVFIRDSVLSVEAVSVRSENGTHS